eukprot:scaffold5152_cov113-Isochrysis_galbana.AAC.1
MLAILARQVSHSHSCEIIQSTPSRQSGMVQPVVNEIVATVHAAGSSLLGLFTSCTTFDATIRNSALRARACFSSRPRARPARASFSYGSTAHKSYDFLNDATKARLSLCGTRDTGGTRKRKRYHTVEGTAGLTPGRQGAARVEYTPSDK